MHEQPSICIYHSRMCINAARYVLATNPYFRALQFLFAWGEGQGLGDFTTSDAVYTEKGQHVSNERTLPYKEVTKRGS